MLTDREALDGLSTGVLIAGVDEITTHLNPAGCRMLGVERAASIGQPVPLLLGLSASLRDHGLDEPDTERRFVLTLPTGAAGATLCAVGGRGFVCLFRSAAAGRGADGVLLEDERESALDAIVAGFAHEIRNPLAALSAAVDLLRGELGPGQSEVNLSIIDRQVRRLVALSRAPIDLGRMARVQRVRCDVARLIYTAVAMVAPEAARRHVDVAVRTQPVPQVLAGERELTDALVELLENAVHASPTGAAVSVSTRFASESGRVVIEIVDRGSGMTPAQISEALRAYSTTKVGAVGVGLALAHRLIRDCGGLLALEPAVECGLQVRVELTAEEAR